MRQYYEIRRAKTLAEICGARHGDVTVQHELDKDVPQIKAPPTCDRSKVHPADKYTEGLTAPAIEVNRAPSAMGYEGVVETL